MLRSFLRVALGWLRLEEVPTVAEDVVGVGTIGAILVGGGVLIGCFNLTAPRGPAKGEAWAVRIETQAARRGGEREKQWAAKPASPRAVSGTGPLAVAWEGPEGQSRADARSRDN